MKERPKTLEQLMDKETTREQEVEWALYRLIFLKEMAVTGLEGFRPTDKIRGLTVGNIDRGYKRAILGYYRSLEQLEEPELAQEVVKR